MSDQSNLEAELVRRGVNAQLASWVDHWLEPEVIERTIAWYDRQRGRVGPGVLVAELRKGGAAHHAPVSPAERDRRYVEESRAWLEANCPEIAGRAPALPALGRLRFAHRDAPLEDAELAARVRQAVARWDEEHSEVIA